MRPTETTDPGPGTPSDTDSDAALVARIVARDEAALTEVLRRHGGAVHGIARRMLADEGLARDVTQDVFVRLWQAPERFDAARGTLRTLLLTQAHGRSVDVVRSRNAQRRREEQVAADTLTSADDVDTELLALTQAQQVRQALAALPPDERAAIELAYFGANTYRQVAALLGVPEGTIKTRIRTGLRRLHTVLRDSDDRQGSEQQGSEQQGREQQGWEQQGRDRRVRLVDERKGRP